jgi:hypothetical protein
MILQLPYRVPYRGENVDVMALAGAMLDFRRFFLF